MILAGMGAPEEVARNAAVDLSAPFTAAEQAQAEAIRKTLGSTFCRRCGYCAPCPNGIDIPTNFLLANYLRRYGLADWARERYQALRYHAGSCVQCGACERRCPYGLPIPGHAGRGGQGFWLLSGWPALRPSWSNWAYCWRSGGPFLTGLLSFALLCVAARPRPPRRLRSWPACLGPASCFGPCGTICFNPASKPRPAGADCRHKGEPNEIMLDHIYVKAHGKTI